MEMLTLAPPTLEIASPDEAEAICALQKAEPHIRLELPCEAIRALVEQRLVTVVKVDNVLAGYNLGIPVSEALTLDPWWQEVWPLLAKHNLVESETLIGQFCLNPQARGQGLNSQMYIHWLQTVSPNYKTRISAGKQGNGSAKFHHLIGSQILTVVQLPGEQIKNVYAIDLCEENKQRVMAVLA